MTTDPEEDARRRVLAYVRANPSARRDEIVSTLGADPEHPLDDGDVAVALTGLVHDYLLMQINSSVIDGDRFVAVDQ